MCGIAGIVSFTHLHIINAGELVALSETLKHRGPDDEGFLIAGENETQVFGGESTPEQVFNSKFLYSPQKNISQYQPRNGQLALVHRRLSIIDTSPAGHQPMCTPDKNYWLIFNGEIYNYIEIRNMLLFKGYQFQTQTDTEVLLNAYKEWGSDCVHQLNGMWSFVIYDKKKNILFGSRDRTGVKPFYYFKTNAHFAFASEIKALLKLPFYEKKINNKAAFDFFVFNRVERMEESFFTGINELMPAHSFIININSGDIKKWKYYTPEINCDCEKFDSIKFNDYSSEIKKLIFEAVKIRLRSDVPVGSCLSGGIDSSAVVCVINNLLKSEKNDQIGERQKVFTACFHNAIIDESRWAKIVVEKTNAQWHQTFPEKSKFITDLETLVYCQEIPFISTSTYAQFCVMRLAVENGIKVLLDGQGSDELFSGYRFHYFGLWMELLSHLRFFHLNNEMKFYSGAKSHFLKNFMKYIVLPKLPHAFLKPAYSLYFNELKFLNTDFLEANKTQYENNADTFAPSLNRMLSNEYFSGPLKNLLKYEDRNSMHFSIEARTPFADDVKLFEKLFSIPSQYKIHNGETKALLRQSMCEVMPEAIRNRKDKMGFVTPNNQWIFEMKNELRPYFEQDDSGIFNKEILFKNYDSFFSPATENENYRIFKFISFALWKKVLGM